MAAAAGCLSVMAASPAHADDDMPSRANDLAYGRVLYNYYQGEALNALTLMAVAHEQNPISGHGAYPELVEGGLMLSYGMIREARNLFARLLEQPGHAGGGSPRVTLAPEVRNQAWFYLGKVFYLEGDDRQAYDNLQRVNAEVLKASDSALYGEWLYLRAQLAMASQAFGGEALAQQLRTQLEGSGLWSDYLAYNIAMAEISAGASAQAQESLRVLIDDMVSATPGDNLAAEHRALLNKSRLSLAHLYLRDARFDDALAQLGAMPLDGVFSDRALFDYAVAAAGQGQMERALGALETLSQRTLFLPWREQVPYAKGYVLEQMSRPRAALAAFTQAASHYESRDRELTAARQALTEERMMAGLNIIRDSGGVITDSYGHLRVTPTDFGFAEVLATEPFQQALAELHELYQMQALLKQREGQLSTFKTMLETRRIQHERQSQKARVQLEQQQADEWAQAQAAFHSDIDAALAAGDAEFFMSAEQKALKARLDKVAAILAQLSEGQGEDNQRFASQRKTYQRMKAYFDWTVANDYGVNRWAAQKQLRELDREMAEFHRQRAAVEALMAGDNRHDELAGRLASKAEELQALKVQVQNALSQARSELLGRLKKALEQQSNELRRYLVASRHARARLTDQLFRASQNTEAAND
jgi:hypothetical protein